MANNKSSAQLLEQLWENFVRNTKKENEGIGVSKRTVSQNLLRTEDMSDCKDPHTLSRWTNPGDKENWKIPLSRIKHTVRVLGGTQADVDRLMRARLQEIEQNNPNDSCVITAHWTLGYSMTLLSDDERYLLQAYRKANEGYGGNVFKGAAQSLNNQALLEVTLESCVQQEVQELMDQNEPSETQSQAQFDRLEALKKRAGFQIEQALARVRQRELEQEAVFEQQRSQALKQGLAKRLEGKVVKRLKARLNENPLN